jgi:hypothetical protein
MVNLPVPDRVPLVALAWPHASRLLPARYQAVDCFESIVDPGRHSQGEMLARLADLTATSGAGDLKLLDPSKVLFGAGAGWITPSFTLPRAARFSTPRCGAFYVAEEIATSVEEVRHHIQQDYRRERISGPMDLDYRALTVHVQGTFHDIRSKARNRPPWSTIYDPGSYGTSQAFADSLRAAGSGGITYASVRRPEGACAAVFDPSTLRACRHDTYLSFRWDGTAVVRIVEKRILPLSPNGNRAN